MDAQIYSLIQDAVTKGIESVFLPTLAVMVVISGAAAYLGPYLSKRAEYRATHESFDQILDEVKKTTKLTESVRAENAELMMYNQTKGQQLATKENFAELLQEQRQLMRVQTQVQEEIKNGFALGLERFKWGLQVDLEFKKSVMLPRLNAHLRLWSFLEPVSPAADRELSEEEREQLQKNLKSWYYGEGGGAMLSYDAMQLYLNAIKTLEGTYDKRATIDAFSILRTQTKLNLGVYSPEEAKRKFVAHA